MAENAIGWLSLPLGIATNLMVNGRDVLVPMAIEEPSVVAALSHGARMVRESGGVQATACPPEMIGQIQLLDLADAEAARERVIQAEPELLHIANERQPAMVARGGGARAIEAHVLATSQGVMLIVHLTMNVCDAMGANAVNTAVEALAPVVAGLAGARAGVRVLTNLAVRRLARASCRVALQPLAGHGAAGEDVVMRIIEAHAWAEADPYRAATHNKGIMNGIDAVAIATGNDWRAIEAGAHAYASTPRGSQASGGGYAPLSSWIRADDGGLHGELIMPLAVGTRGASVRAQPLAAVALKIMRIESAVALAEVMAAVGLVQNLAALRALAVEGIQEGHMRLHARQVALAAGAQGPEVDALAKRMVSEGKIREARAIILLKEIRDR
jgi:hydroxymethylglutaryl-CoA reductase